MKTFTKAEYETFLNIIEGLIKLFSNPSRWTQKTMARDANDDPVDINDIRARSFCLVGGINVIRNNFYLDKTNIDYTADSTRIIDYFEKFFEKNEGWYPKGHFNDQGTVDILTIVNDFGSYENMMNFLETVSLDLIDKLQAMQ